MRVIHFYLLLIVVIAMCSAEEHETEETQGPRARYMADTQMYIGMLRGSTGNCSVSECERLRKVTEDCVLILATLENNPYLTIEEVKALCASTDS